MLEHGVREALLFQPQADGTVLCQLCAHRCVVRSGRRGICGVRENRGGRLVTLVGERVIAANTDPIEKKPFFHFLPGSLAYSVSTVGCNFHCSFCQNADISQWPRTREGPVPGQATTPRAIVAAALAADCRSIAYTYTEPTIFFELALDTCRLAAAAGLKNVFVTNGYMTAEALEMLAPVLHAANVDLKGFTDAFYRKRCGATLRPVLDSVRRLREAGIWVEVTTLVIPGLNDSDAELGEAAHWLAALDPNIPWHLSAFRPAYKMLHTPPTPRATLLRAAAIGQSAGVRFVYIGNLAGGRWENTFCPQCARTLITRRGFSVLGNHLADGHCPDCRATIPGVWRFPGTAAAV